MKINPTFFVLFALLFAACSTPPPPAPTIDVLPSATLTILPLTETPTATIAPTPTEIPSYPVCALENFENCTFTLEDFTSGKVDAWLDTLKRPFDLEKMNPVPLEIFGGSRYIIPDHRTAPNFEVPGSETFHRDTTFGLLTYEEDGKTYTYVFIPVEFYDPKTGESHWVKTIAPVYDPPGKNLGIEARANYIRETWEKINVVPIGTSSRYSGNIDFSDPLISRILAQYPDMQQRIDKFVSGDDMSGLSGSDMLFLAYIMTASDDSFK